MTVREDRDTFKLEIPLDASGIEDFKHDQSVKVAVQNRKWSVSSQTVKLDAKGQGIATFTFFANPGTLRILVGPESASDEELLGMQTLNLDLPARQWVDRRELRLPPILIPPYYWHWWLRWCPVR